MERKLAKQPALHYPEMLQTLWESRIESKDWYYNLHENDMEELEKTISCIKELYKDVNEAAELHMQTILELQRIQQLAHQLDEPINRPIGVALSELEAKFHRIHDKWSES